MTLAFYDEIARRLRAGQTLAIATLVERQGSAPRDRGTKMLVTAGEIAFSIGGGAFEALIIEDAREAIRLGQGLEKIYRFTEQGEGATGMVCGGTVRVSIEVVRPPEVLVVFGGGHVGRELAHLGDRLGFAVTVIDDRERFLDPSRYPEGVRRALVAPDYAGGLPEILPGAYVAILTRCHRTDLEALRHVVGKQARYVGVIGSRRKIATLLARAQDLGTSPEALVEVHAPIGLSIGAETPEEIAISIAAELIGIRRTVAANLARPAGRRAAGGGAFPVTRFPGRRRAAAGPGAGGEPDHGDS